MEKFELTINISSLEECEELSKQLSILVKHHTNVITLTGDLGAGKTTFTRYFVQNFLNEETEVTSPTFNLVHIYGNKQKIWHFDLYRLKNSNEIYEIGLEEALESDMMLVEWPAIAQHLLPFERLDINIIWISESNERIFKLITSSKDLYQTLFHNITRGV